MPHTISIETLDGRPLDGWERYTIAHDMLRTGTGSWSLTLKRRSLSRTEWRALLTRVSEGARIVFRVDGVVQLVGIVRASKSGFDRDSGHAHVASGRDLASVAQECDADPRLQLRDTQLGAVAHRLLDDLGVPVVLGDGVTVARVQSRGGSRAGAVAASRPKPIKLVKVRTGQRVWAVLDEICQRNGYLLWSGPHPAAPGGVGIVIDAPVETGPSDFAFTRLEVDPSNAADSVPVERYAGNIMDADVSRSIEDVPTEIRVFAHTRLGEKDDVRQEIVVPNGSVPDGIPPARRFARPRRAHTIAEARASAQRTIARANAGLMQYGCLVQGHGPASGRLFALNKLATVHDDALDVHGTFLITRVVLDGSRSGGQIARLGMSPAGAIKVYPDQT